MPLTFGYQMHATIFIRRFSMNKKLARLLHLSFNLSAPTKSHLAILLCAIDNDKAFPIEILTLLRIVAEY